MRKNPRLQKALDDLDVALHQWLTALDNQERLAIVHRRLKNLLESARNAGDTSLLTDAMRIEKPLSVLLDVPQPSPRNALHTAEALKGLLGRHNPPREVDISPPAARADAAPIYIVNSNAIIGEDVAMQLRCFGHSVEVLTDMAKAEAAMRVQPPAALIVDSEYREDLLERLSRLAQQRRETGQDYPITLISTRGNFKARLAAARAGVDCYFTRPVDVAALTDRLDALIFSKEAHPYRVLIIGSEEDTAREYEAVLRQEKMDTQVLYNPTAIFQTLDEYRPELIVMDVNTPACTGIDLTRLIRQNNVYLDIPILFLSGDASLAHRIDAVHAGADGFLAKPFVPADFISALSSRAERYRALRGLIMRDSLTGLLNHSAVKETLVREMAGSGRSGAPLSLAMIDIDFFKRVNDTHGHPVGDQVLRTLSRLLQQRLRRGDVVGRYGGEEFAVILPGTAAKAAASVLDGIRDSFSRIRHQAEDHTFSVTFSSGVTDITSHESADAMFRAADAALYAAKHKGRNRIELG